LLTALAGLAVLTRPGRAAPDARGAVLMAVAGAAWGVYSLRGRGVGDPLRRTAASFTAATLAGIPILLLTGHHDVTGRGVVLASLSGAVASGLGYTLWYAALPHLSAFRAAVLQLSVPALTACAAVPILGERPSMRLVTAGLLILGGIALAMAGRRRLS
jgi:drug/metabolite transporter (DMT)-like permease